MYTCTISAGLKKIRQIGIAVLLIQQLCSCLEVLTPLYITVSNCFMIWSIDRQINLNCICQHYLGGMYGCISDYTEVWRQRWIRNCRNYFLWWIWFIWISTYHNQAVAHVASLPCAIVRKIDFTHLPLDKVAAISQTTFSNAFSGVYKFVFWIGFHWSN